MERLEFVAVDPTSASQVDEFVGFARRLYGSENALALNTLAKRKETIAANPDATYLLAKSKGEVVGAMAVGTSESIRDENKNPYGYIGFFDVVDDYELFRAMLDHAKSRLSLHRWVLFPFFKSTFYEYRYVVRRDFDLFSDMPTRGYYIDFIERYGYADSELYRSHYCDDLSALLATAEKFHYHASKRGVRFRPFDKRNASRDVASIYEIVVKAFKDHKYYAEVSFDAFKAIYVKQLRSLEENLITFAENKHKEVLGFVFSLPDFTPLFQKHDLSKLRGKLGALVEKRRLKGMIVKTTAVDPDKPVRAVYPGLMYANVKWAYDNGYEYLIGAYFHADHIHNSRLPPHPWKNRYCLYKLNNG